MDLGLRGKRAIITGATKGIGRATAELFASEGVHVGFCARDKNDIVSTAHALRDWDVTVCGEAVDVRDRTAYIDWLRRVTANLGGCDIFIPNVSAIGGHEADDWLANFEVDVMHTVRGCETLMPHLMESGVGAIVIISSTNAVESRWAPASYNAMKAALITYAKQLSQHVAPRGVRVNSVSPGPILYKGGIWDGIRNDNLESYNDAIAQIPVGRMGTPEEVARIVAFMASPAASIVIGSNIIADHGFTKRVQF